MGELKHAYHTIMFARAVNKFDRVFYKSNLNSIEELYKKIVRHGKEINKIREEAGVEREKIVDIAIDALGLKMQYAKSQISEEEYLQRRENLLPSRKA